MVSRAAAIILMGMYILLLVFVLWTHKDIMGAESENVEMSPHPSSKDVVLKDAPPSSSTNVLLKDAGDAAAEFVVNHGPHVHGHHVDVEHVDGSEDEDEDEVELTLIGSLTLLLIATVVVSWLSELSLCIES